MDYNENWDRIDNMQDVADYEYHQSWLGMMSDLIYREEDYEAMQTTDEQRAGMYYRTLVEKGYDATEAAWMAAEEFDLLERHADPMAPDYEALAREPHRGDYHDAAEAPAVQ